MALVTADRRRFPVDEWKLVETSHVPGDEGPLETLFALGNGHLGIRGAHPAAADTHLPGTFINGFHETFDIKHAENAYGFARQGQRILYLPDAQAMVLSVDGEELTLGASTVLDYRRSLDFATGVYERRTVWACRSGATVTTTERRVIGFTSRSSCAIVLELSADRRVSVDLTSLVINRQDQQVEDHSEHDPRRAGRHAGRVLTPLHTAGQDGSLRLAWATETSQQHLGLAVDHHASGALHPFSTAADPDESTVRYVLALEPGDAFRLEKRVGYATGLTGTGQGLAAAAENALTPAAQLLTESTDHYQRYWQDADIQVGGQPELQQAIRWNLFQLAQATARAGVAGIPAKGVSGSGYEGHYFWDQEIYLMPYLTYTNPAAARQVLQFRHEMLPAARARAAELSVEGALFPWRTINGQEASAYYAAGTAQFHINAAIAFAAARYAWATGDETFRTGPGAELLTETARIWISLGFFGKDGRFHIHGVTGPDEYTAVVNDNLYTNVMARFNLRAAAAAEHPSASSIEQLLWREAADRITVPYDRDLRLHCQDNDFMSLEPWDWTTPRSKYPLLLHFHPLVIYRHQVLKQSDTVLAMFLHWQDFTPEEKHRAFDFYDPITTGDSTLSACVQGIMAAEIGYTDKALHHFTTALFIDLDNLHHNTVDGIHTASAGGVWSSLVSGFASFRDQAELPYFDPRLPQHWENLTFTLQLHGRTLHVHLTADTLTLHTTNGAPLHIQVQEHTHTITNTPQAIPLHPAPEPQPSTFPRPFPTTELPIITAHR